MILSSNTLVEDDNKKVDFPLSSFTNPGLLLWLFGTLFWSISFLFPHIFLVSVHLKEFYFTFGMNLWKFCNTSSMFEIHIHLRNIILFYYP